MEPGCTQYLPSMLQAHAHTQTRQNARDTRAHAAGTHIHRHNLSACMRAASSIAPGWLNEADVQFFLGGAPPNPELVVAAEGKGEDPEAAKIVQVKGGGAEGTGGGVGRVMCAARTAVSLLAHVRAAFVSVRVRLRVHAGVWRACESEACCSSWVKRDA